MTGGYERLSRLEDATLVDIGMALEASRPLITPQSTMVVLNGWKWLLTLLQDRAVACLGVAAVPHQAIYFNHPPGGRETPPHQDAMYMHITPREAVTLWVALDAADEDNSCMRYVAGSHRLGLRHHQLTDVPGFSWGIPDYGTDHDRAGEVTVRVSPGSVVAHHCLTIHRADANRSNRHRRAIGLVYYRDDVVEDAEALAAYQRQLSLERDRA